MKISSSQLALFFGLILLLPSVQCEYAAMQPVDNALGVTAVMDSIGLMTTSLFIVGDPAAVSISLSAKMFVYIKYMNVDYADVLASRFEAQRTTSVFLDFRFDMKNTDKAKFTTSPPPDAYARYDMKPNFIVNFWPGFITLIFVYGVLTLLIGSRWLAENTSIQIMKPTTLYQLRVSWENVCWMIFYNAYPDIVLYSFVDFRSTKVQSGRDAFSFCVAVMFLIGGGIILWKHAKILLKHRQLLKKTGELAAKELAAFYKEHETIQILYKGFKTTSFAKQFCLFIITGRAVLSSFVIAMLYTSPVGECLLLMGIDIAIFIYFIKATPFEDKYQRALQITSEVLYATLILCVFINANMDSLKDTSDGRLSLGRYIIVVNIFYNFLVLGFICGKIFLATKEAFQLKPQTSPIMRPAANAALSGFDLDSVIGRSPSNDRLRPKITVETVNTSYSPNNNDSTNYSSNFDKPAIRPEAVEITSPPKVTLGMPDESFHSLNSNQSFLGQEKSPLFPNRGQDSELASPVLQVDFVRGTSLQIPPVTRDQPRSNTLQVDYNRGSSMSPPYIKKDKRNLSSFYHFSERNTPTNYTNHMIRKDLSPRFDPLAKNTSYFSKALRPDGYTSEAGDFESLANSMQAETFMTKKGVQGKSSDYDTEHDPRFGNGSHRTGLNAGQMERDSKLSNGTTGEMNKDSTFIEELKKLESKVGKMKQELKFADDFTKRETKIGQTKKDSKSSNGSKKTDFKIQIKPELKLENEFHKVLSELEAERAERMGQQLKLGSARSMEFDPAQIEQDTKLGNGSHTDIPESNTAHFGQKAQTMKYENGFNQILSPSYSPHNVPNYTPNSNRTPTYVESILFNKPQEESPMKKTRKL